jgi:hypothetical protein
MSSEKFEFKTKKEKDWLLGLLQSEIVELTFTKKDGTERIMKCTLSELKIATEFAPKGVERSKKDEAVAVFDLENNGWRSFRWDSLKNINFTIESIKNA